MIKQSLICSLNGQSKQSESWTPNTARKRNSAYDIALEELENCLSSGITVEDEVEGKLLVQTIEDFLDTLSQDNRAIFMRRYWFSDSYAEIALQVGISEKAVSVRLTRIRSQLREHLTKKGYWHERKNLFLEGRRNLTGHLDC